jgi:hypothetical protein
MVEYALVLSHHAPVALKPWSRPVIPRSMTGASFLSDANDRSKDVCG